MIKTDKITKFSLKPHSSDAARVLTSLEQGKFVKIICGAANTNEKHVERLAFLYALSGADCLDVCPDENIVDAAFSGIKTALELYGGNPEEYERFNNPLVMVSVNAGDDLHFRKAEINRNICTNCGKCVKICPADAVVLKAHFAEILEKKCFGCGKCAKVCKTKAVNFIKINNNLKNFSGIKAIEIHTGNNSIKEVNDFLELNRFLLQNIELLSFSVESTRFTAGELADYVKSLTNLVAQKVIVQVDGTPMSATDKADSSRQAINSAAVLTGEKVDAYVQLAGGSNDKTKNLVNQSGIKISGIGYGTFARKKVLSYIEELNDSEFLEKLQEILNITTNLVEN